ncbi:hypothetical protein GGI07_005158 [Coemansia sp. Benny D115]|nr:hypothetical protein GGI07_005158 [Coemansia sp. Benny D115]
MEEANRLSRKAADHERKQEWAAAAQAHRGASKAYMEITQFDFDPVAKLSLSALGNKHMRWAEHCERELELQRSPSMPSASRGSTTFPPGSEGIKLPDTGLSNRLSASSLRDRKSDKEEREFEDFWRYMQNWLADPAAFTRPLLPSGQSMDSQNTGSGSGAFKCASPPPQGIMESFYLVGPNPDLGASVYAPVSAATTPKPVTPLHVLQEEDEPDEASLAAEEATAKAAEAIGGFSSTDAAHEVGRGNSETLVALMDENQKLRMLVRHLNERIRTLESAAQENNMLKSSILNFREEFHRHANVVALPRMYEQSPVYRRSQTPPTKEPSAASDVLIRQLQSQLESLALENSKQKAQVSKYRERWEKLKESAKRKRQQQQQQQQEEV